MDRRHVLHVAVRRNSYRRITNVVSRTIIKLERRDPNSALPRVVLR